MLDALRNLGAPDVQEKDGRLVSSGMRFATGWRPAFDVTARHCVRARPDWNHYLEIQKQLLFGITHVVIRVGTSIAVPLPMYVTTPGTLSPGGHLSRP